jgi:hypothetical protein
LRRAVCKGQPFAGAAEGGVKGVQHPDRKANPTAQGTTGAAQGATSGMAVDRPE